MFDEFIYQFQNFCFFRNKIKSAQDQNYIKLKDSESLPNFDDCLKILTRFKNESGILDKDGKFIEHKEVNTIHTFGYYSLVAIAKLYIIIGEVDKSIETLGLIDDASLKIYSKSWSCLSSLFYFAGSAYLLNKKYIEATKLLETIVCFSDKYKHFFTK